MVINRQDGIGAVTVILDTLDMSSEASWRSAPSVEYAPPSYSEALQQTRSPTTPSSSSSVLRQTQQAPLSPPERDSEPPPSYDEAVAALHYHHDHHDALSTAPCPQYTDSVTHEHLNAAPSAEQTQTQFSPLTIHSQQHSIYYNSNKEDTIVLPTVTG
ncbi:uncharacterized protein LOC106872218 [Octopus bimaculoides]|uniref:Uncharacterized protein n=1 Tax=Octopus bimaculoides TaxID=37653 RepID=A0A0L8H9P3_OCTBM|nr:uncharacterized protein LOC106872218 [Octopus bimaculoides]|eukprot:XP_014774613.1 PREDICTED: uncharacterized protein LOC106872218 [Octopus bimaculoides]